MSAQIIPFRRRAPEGPPATARVYILRDSFVRVSDVEVFSVWLGWPDAEQSDGIVRKLLFSGYHHGEAMDEALAAAERLGRPLVDMTDPDDAA